MDFLRNIFYGEGIPIWQQIAVIAIIPLIFALTIDLDKTMTCKNRYSYCTAESHNFFNIKMTEKLFMPKNVSMVKITSRQKIVGRWSHNSHLETRFRVNLVNNKGKSITVFDYLDPMRAEETKKKIQECIEQGPYPCQVKR